MISGVESGILMTIRSSRGRMRLTRESRNLYFALPAGSMIHSSLAGRRRPDSLRQRFPVAERVDEIAEILGVDAERFGCHRKLAAVELELGHSRSVIVVEYAANYGVV